MIRTQVHYLMPGTSEFKKGETMSKIMDFLLQPDTIIFFDVDGVLAPYEFGKLRHCIGDYEWKQRLEAGEDLYSMISPIKLLQAFIKRKGTDNIYVYLFIVFLFYLYNRSSCIWINLMCSV